MKKIVNSIYDVYSGKLPRSFDGMKIAMLSDLHDNVYGISLEKLYGMIVEQEPELVIVAGDLLTPPWIYSTCPTFLPSGI